MRRVGSIGNVLQGHLSAPILLPKTLAARNSSLPTTLSRIQPPLTASLSTTPRTRSSSLQTRPFLSQHSRSYSYRKNVRTFERPEYFAKTDDAAVVAFLNKLFPPLLFPQEVALRIMTHTSWKGGQDGHNARLAFVGRRVLAAYFNLFLHSCTGSALATTGNTRFDEQHDYKALFERVMHTHQLGEHVGGAWRIEEVMRWLPANVDHAADGPDAMLRSTGLYKVRGVTVEAAMGGIYHQFGGAVAQRVFHTRLLPHLSKPGLGLPEAFRGRVTEFCEEMGGLEGGLLLKGELLPPLTEQSPLLTTGASRPAEQRA